jgi:hypothetical protein
VKWAKFPKFGNNLSDDRLSNQPGYEKFRDTTRNVNDGPEEILLKLEKTKKENATLKAKNFRKEGALATKDTQIAKQMKEVQKLKEKVGKVKSTRKRNVAVIGSEG